MDNFTITVFNISGKLDDIVAELQIEDIDFMFKFHVCSVNINPDDFNNFLDNIINGKNTSMKFAINTPLENCISLTDQRVHFIKDGIRIIVDHSQEIKDAFVQIRNTITSMYKS